MTDPGNIIDIFEAFFYMGWAIPWWWFGQLYGAPVWPDGCTKGTGCN